MHPQNVFVMQGSGGQSERIKILDFGISKIASVSQKITGMAAVMGTPQYMSPEQAEGKTDELDAASDQFSLAAIVEMDNSSSELVDYFIKKTAAA